MNIAKLVEKIIEETDEYQSFLNTVSEERFLQTPAEGIWSLSEVYSHIFYSNLSSLFAMEKCIHGHPGSSETINWTGRLVLLFGRFPRKLKTSEKLAIKVQKISIEDARNSIIQFKNKLLEISSQIKKAPADSKVKHPRLGSLNAKQWLKFILIHTKHHLKQLNRIGDLLNN